MSCSEGLAVGVGFGAIGKTPSATFIKARYRVSQHHILTKILYLAVQSDVSIIV